jgi:hypothetical protein
LSDTLAAKLARALSARAVDRWGAVRASQLTEAIESTAATLALVAAACFDVDEFEPDPGVDGGTVRVYSP